MTGEVFRRVVRAKAPNGQEREVIVYRMASINPPFVPEIHVSYLGTEHSTVVYDLPSLLEMINALVDAGKASE